MDIQVTGRKVKITEEFRAHVTERLGSVEKFKDRLQRAEVQVTKAQGPTDELIVEITLVGKGPVVRASGRAEDKLVAFDVAVDKLKTQLRKAADRRKDHRGLRHEDLGNWLAELPLPEPTDDAPQPEKVAGDVFQTGDGPLAVREKVFTGVPLTLAQALDEMELVGHDFFLYVDAETKQPSVVYRRKGYSYGVIHLAEQS